MTSLLDLVKWQIFFKTLPFTLLFCLAKWGFHLVGWEPWKFDSFTGALFGTATFVIALVLSGTLSDFRSSEDIPTLIVNALESIQDNNQLVAASHAEYDPKPLQSGLVEVNQAIQGWLLKSQDMSAVYTALDALNPLFVPLAAWGGSPSINRGQAEQAKIRLLVARIQGNRDSEFLGPAYVMLFVFLVGAVIALLLIGADSFSENLVVAGFLFTSFCYLLVLIRDLDNPFQYNGSSSVEVDLSALTHLSKRWQA